MRVREPMTHSDWCRLGQVFVAHYNSLDWQDSRINDFLKAMLIEAEEGRPDPLAEKPKATTPTRVATLCSAFRKARARYIESDVRLAVAQSQLAQRDAEIARLWKVVKAAKLAVDNRSQVGGYHYTEKLIAAIKELEAGE